ncbi:potassium transporter Kup [Desulfolutivibrio sulfoxidireducens]|uniref:potassium transporter Kup n=1 Tax=Desulfolutivibrio sulfoxidireducens TaxID=2773299 RepID=UPI00159DBAA3|nr:potassium transporter Kup [Desulfolutivibrio sulfoxidireducens]QLA15334.1 potassium transporter Kup [Desulfolutivibrio sulfoxidireducens]QLA18912.1 potassium transporter Kup [Desulfolutivibrio sulfoxidireducens]
MPETQTDQTPAPLSDANPPVGASDAAPEPSPSGNGGLSRGLGLALGALGIVYGDIGTSPLYALKECFHGLHAVPLYRHNVLGVLSLVFWSLTVVVTIKYVLFILRADNKGEGGIFALLELLPKGGSLARVTPVLTFLGLCGAALLYGDGVITPAISVLSAVEGLNTATDAAAPFVLPITCGVLFALFAVQRHGTAGIGRVFGPVMLIWFTVIGAIGLMHIFEDLSVLQAISPVPAVRFFMENHLHGMIVLGAVVLCITGGEALYADMGHFGAGPIRLSWLTLVFPALILNYFGQGAGLLARPEIAANPFYGIVPRQALYPMVALATMATVIASQAMISGVFSLTRQAIQLGVCPRLRIIHTSSDFEGQLYIPEINFALMWACIGLVFIFKESGRLAAAYGIAVTATMGITSILYFFVARYSWKKPLWKVIVPVAVFLAFDLSYFSANLLKILDGGWFTVLIAAMAVAAMATWRDGRKALHGRFMAVSIPLADFLAEVAVKQPYRVPGTAVFMSVSPTGTPLTILHSFKHTKVLHEHVVILTVTSADTPYVDPGERLTISDLGQGFNRVVARYGFMETPNVPRIMVRARAAGLVSDGPSDTTFFLGRETLLTTGRSGLASWRKKLFAVMSQNARPATTYFGIPPGRVVELGVQVEL